MYFLSTSAIPRAQSAFHFGLRFLDCVAGIIGGLVFVFGSIIGDSPHDLCRIAATGQGALGVIERDLVKQDDELHQIRVGLLPKRFLATTEEVIQKRGDVVDQGACIQVALKGVVSILGIEADFDVVLSPAVACEDFLYSVAEVPSYFKDQAANSLLHISRAVGQNLFREWIHAAARFS